MKLPVFFGVVAGIVFSLVLLGVVFFREAAARNERTAEAFMSACESTGGKPVWNFKYWECLK